MSSKGNARRAPAWRRNYALNFIGRWTIVTFVALAFRLLVKAGRVRVKGRERLQAAVAEGRFVICSNHPSWLETLWLPIAVSWPQCLREERMMPWSIAREDMLPPRLRWLLHLLYCLPVCREDAGDAPREATRKQALTADSMKRARFILKEGGIVICYPEGDVTASGASFVTKDARRITVFGETGVLRLARAAGARVLPVYVDFTPVEKVRHIEGFAGLLERLWLLKRSPMVIYCGESYVPDFSQTQEEGNRELALRILTADA